MTPVMAPQPAAPTPIRSPNRIAEQLTGRPYVSHSQLSLMRSCPRKFAFHYVENASADFTPSYLLYGGSIHAALEAFYRGFLEGSTLDADELMEAYTLEWHNRHQTDIPIRFNVGEDESTVEALARRTIDAFLVSSLATPKGMILGIEETLTLTLHEELPDILAKVDLVTQTETSLNVIDFKTSRSKWTQQKALESGDQLLLYGSTAAGMSRFLNLPIRLHFAVLTKAKKPVVQLLEIPVDEDRLARMTQTALQTWQAVLAGNFYPNPGPQNCSTCPYKSRCPAFTGSSR